MNHDDSWWITYTEQLSIIGIIESLVEHKKMQTMLVTGHDGLPTEKADFLLIDGSLIHLWSPLMAHLKDRSARRPRYVEEYNITGPVWHILSMLSRYLKAMWHHDLFLFTDTLEIQDFEQIIGCFWMIQEIRIPHYTLED